MNFPGGAPLGERTEGRGDVSEEKLSEILSLTNSTSERERNCCWSGLGMLYENVELFYKTKVVMNSDWRTKYKLLTCSVCTTIDWPHAATLPLGQAHGGEHAHRVVGGDGEVAQAGADGPPLQPRGAET